MDKTKQQVTVSNEDASVIRGVFSKNEYLLKTLRNLLLGLELSDSDKELVSVVLKDEKIKKIILQRFFPTISNEMDMGQAYDMWTGLDLVGKSPLESKQTIEVRQRMIEQTKIALALLDNPNGTKPSIAYSTLISDEFGIELTARNRFIGHIVYQCQLLGLIAGTEEPTAKEIKERQEKDSSK